MALPGLEIGLSAPNAQLISDMRSAQSVVEASARAMGSSIDGMSGATERATYAGTKLIKSLQDQVDTFGMSKLQLAQYRANLNGVGAEAEALINKLNSLKVAEKAANDEVMASIPALRAHGQEVKVAGGHIEGFSFKTAAAKRELLVLAHELSQGNYSKFGGSMMVLGERTGAAALLFSAAGIAVLGLIAAIGGLAYAALKGAAESEALNNSIKLTGNYAGITAGEFNNMARALGESSGGGIGKARAALHELASTGVMTSTTMQVVGGAAITMSKLTGQSADEVAKELSKMEKGVTAWADEHNKQYHFLSVAQYEYIRRLEEQGQKQMAMQETGRLLDESLKKNEGTLGFLQQRIKAAGDNWKWFWDKALDVGRATTVEDKIASLQDKMSRQIDKRNSQAEIDRLTDSKNRDGLRAAEKSIELQVQAQGIIASNELKGFKERYASKTEQAAKEIKLYKTAVADRIAAGQGGVDSEAKQAEMIAAIRERFKEKGGSAKAKVDPYIALNKAIQEKLSIQALELQSDSKLTEGQKLAAKFVADLADGTLKLTNAQKAQYTANLEHLIANDRMIEQRQKEEKATLAAAEAQTKYIESLQKEATKTKDDVAQQKELNARIGLTAKAIVELDAAKLQEQATTLDGIAIKNLDKNLDESEYNLIKAKAQALRDLADAKREGQIKQSITDEADAATKEWKKAADDIDKSLSTAIMNGFSGAKGFAHDFVNSLKGLFAKMVLRPILAPISAGIASFMNPGAAGAAGTAGSSLSALGSASSLYSAFGSAGALSGSTSGIAMGSTYGTAALSQQSLMLAAQETSGYASTAMSAASSAGTYLSQIAAAAPYAAAIAASIYAGMKISGDYRVEGIGGLLRYLGPVGGLLNRAFGRESEKLTDAGYKGSVNGQSSTGTSFANFESKGGWFRSDGHRNETSAIDPTFAGAVGQGFVGIQQATMQSARLLGLGTAGVANTSQDYTFNKSTGGTEQERAKIDQENTAKLFVMFSDNLAKVLIPTIDAFKHSGESASQTLQRLSADFGATNVIAEMLGKTVERTFGALSVESVKARENIISLTGGLSALSAKLGSYYNNFYSQEERNANVMKDVGKALAEVGVRVPATRAAFRALVEAQNLTTEAGQKTYAALMNVADAFASVIPAATEAAIATTKLTQAQLDANVTAAKSALQTSYQAESSALNNTIAAMQSFAESTNAFRLSLLTGTLSPLTPQQKYEQSASQYNATSSGALRGDPQAQKDLQNAAQTFLQASRVTNASGSQYTADFARVQADLAIAAAAAKSQVTDAQMQLLALNRQVDGLITVNQSVLSVRDAVMAVNAAVEAAKPPPFMFFAAAAPRPVPDMIFAKAPDTSPVVAEIKGLREELAGLRTDQNTQTGALIETQLYASADNAEQIGTAFDDGIRDASFRESTQIALK